MANTYTRLYVQCVLAVQDRPSLIRPEWEQHLYRCISEIVSRNKHKMIIVNGMEDHVHLLIGLHAAQSISELIHRVRQESSEWVNLQKLATGPFAWQEGYGAFSYGRSQVNQVYHHIVNQMKHHKTLSFQEEYGVLLETFGIPFDKRYIFKEIK
jgi:putative transposase